jgi:hypothetical protein
MSRRRILFIGLTIILVAIVTPFVRQFLNVRSAERRLAEITTELDLNDPGWRLHEIENNRKHVPEHLNSGPTISAAHAKLAMGWNNQKIFEEIADVRPNAAYTPSQSLGLSVELDKCEQALAEARQVADLTWGRYYITYTEDCISTLLPHAQKVREIGSLLSMEAKAQADRGNMKEALTACRATIHSSRAMGDDPLLICQLVRMAIRNDAIKATQRVLAQGGADAADLKSLQEVYEAEARDNLALIGVRGERAALHQTFQYLTKHRVPPGTLIAGKPTIRQRIAGFLGGDTVEEGHAWALRHMTEAVAITKLPPEEQAAARDAIDKAPADAPSAARELVPAWARVVSTCQRSVGQMRMAAAALAAERYRIDHGAWPKDIAALAPKYLDQVPQDPYAAQPLGYRITDDGIVFYMVGPEKNRKGDFWDNAGATPDGESAFFEFRLWSPEARRLGALH